MKQEGFKVTVGGVVLEETENKTEEQIRNEDLQRVANFRWIDDTFARVGFKDHAKLGEFVLRIITGLDDLEIDEESFETQYDAKRLAGSRSLMLDVRGVDLKGRKYDLEMEKWDASPERAEVHGAAMIVEHLLQGDEFKDLNETYVIFMCEHDVVGNGRAVNQFSNRNDDLFKENVEIESSIKAHESMGGKLHIIFVNGDYGDETSDIGKLIHDFKCRNADDMYFSNLAERTREIKENPEEVDKVCKVMEDLRIETEQRTLVQAIKNVMESLGVSAEKAMDTLKVPDNQRSFYAGMINPKTAR